jgi:hypothetical protein
VDEDYRRVSPMTPAEIGRWRSVLEARRDWLARRGIRYLVVVAPNKETIYGDAVPPWFTRAAGPSRLAQLDQAFAGQRGIDLLDLSGALAARTAEVRTYHFTDTHWNDMGAFAGYGAIARRLEPWFPGLKPLELADVTPETVVTRGGDLARVCGLQTDLPEPQTQLHPLSAVAATFADGSPITIQRTDVRARNDLETRSPTGEIPSAVILRDSFGEALMPFLSRHFQRGRWIWTDDFPADLIAEVKPSLVIEQTVERKLMNLVPANPPEVDARP